VPVITTARLELKATKSDLIQRSGGSCSRNPLRPEEQGNKKEKPERPADLTAEIPASTPSYGHRAQTRHKPKKQEKQQQELYLNYSGASQNLLRPSTPAERPDLPGIHSETLKNNVFFDKDSRTL
jgi:hypothetical protein